MQINNYLDTGGIIIRPNFFKLDVFNNFIKYLNKVKHTPTYQPSRLYYGNRFQAYPCYDYQITNSQYGNIIKKETFKRKEKGFLRGVKEYVDKEMIK